MVALRPGSINHYKQTKRKGITMPKIKLIFKIKNQYGNLRYFPDCDNAKKLINCYRRFG